MGRVVVDVMPKPEILDPQGKAVAGALPRLGFTGFTDVRQGKRFELAVDGEVTDEVLASVREAAATLLSNPVIEDVVRVAELPEETGPGEAAPDEAAVGASADSVVAADSAAAGVGGPAGAPR
jgi:phosphoribosylformylglycinamidine synthase subunit PurS